MQREKFSSRLGFILISAGCAIGLGNVWRFPYIVGKYGGAAFVLIYLLFLLILGLPIMVMEFSVGRASQASAALSFDRAGAQGHQVALVQVRGHGRQLSADDVLHHHCRLDGGLSDQNGHRPVPGAGRRGRGPGVPGDAEPSPAHGRIYGAGGGGLLPGLRQGPAKGRGENHQGDDDSACWCCWWCWRSGPSPSPTPARAFPSI